MTDWLNVKNSLLCWLLIPLSWVYSIVVNLRNKLYDAKKLTIRHLDAKVISVGNITVGGTGKTPIVEYVARHFKEKGLKVCVLSRGYKRKSKGTQIVTDGSQILTRIEDAGDEPFLLAQRLHGIPIVVDSDRYRGGFVAQKQFSPDIIILDDGFQHRRLARDVDIVSLDGSKPFGNGRILPAGPLREKPNSLTRADVILLTQVNDNDVASNINTIIKFCSAPVFKSAHRPLSLIGEDGSFESPQILNGKNIIAFCGIANPKRFHKTLANLGAQVCEFLIFPDHHFYGRAQIQKIAHTALKMQAACVVTTEKDWVRLPPKLPQEIQWRFLSIELAVEDAVTFFEYIETKCGLQ